MKTNMITLILSSITVGAVALALASRVTASNLPMIAASVSYLAVAVLVAVAAIDYRAGARSYLTR